MEQNSPSEHFPKLIDVLIICYYLNFTRVKGFGKKFLFTHRKSQKIEGAPRAPPPPWESWARKSLGVIGLNRGPTVTGDFFSYQLWISTRDKLYILLGLLKRFFPSS